jgi:hypothetical protein
MAINDGGGLVVGNWVKAPQGRIVATKEVTIGQGTSAGEEWGLNIKNGNGAWSHFNYNNTNQNYLRGVTMIDNLRAHNTLHADALRLGDKFRMSGVGDANGNDEWLRLSNIHGNNYSGGFAANKLWSANGQVQASDFRMKENIQDVTRNDMEKLQKLTPKKYNYKGKKEGNYGFIAQDVEKVYPDIVRDGPNGMKALHYNDIIPLVVKNVQDIRQNVPSNDKLCIEDVCLTKGDLLNLKRQA